MRNSMYKIKFEKNESFRIEHPDHISYLYFPIAGEAGIKADITPDLGGDSKIDQNTFLMEPVSAENLHNNRSTRNFWCKVNGKGAWSVTGKSAEEENRKLKDEPSNGFHKISLITMPPLYERSVIVDKNTTIFWRDFADFCKLPIQTPLNYTMFYGCYEYAPDEKYPFNGVVPITI